MLLGLAMFSLKKISYVRLMVNLRNPNWLKYEFSNHMSRLKIMAK
jgi:hypothetical protein